MAITITQQPYPDTPANQYLIVTAVSDNVTEDGFRYKFVVNSQSVYKPPNPSSTAIINLAQFIQPELIYQVNILAIHQALDFYPDSLSPIVITTEVYEAWEVAGILTDDPDSLGPETIEITVWPASFQAEDGYLPSLDRFVLDGETKRWLSDRTQSTHVWQYAGLYGFPQTGNKVYIPVREADWGVMNAVFLGSANDVKVTLYESNGSPVTATIADADKYSFFGVYPANLNSNTLGLPKPSDYPNWRCVTIQCVEGADSYSVLYVLYNVALNDPQSCAYDTIRMAWAGSGGSWEYFNFTKKNEESIEIDRKRYSRVLGDYQTDYTMNKWARGRTEVGNITERLLTINSDWISEGEFQFLRGMMVSRQVHWVQDDGTFIPMLVEDNTYTEQRTRDGKLKNLTVKLSYANNLWT